MDTAEVRYAKSGDLHIAYKISGHGPPDLVLVPGIIDTIEGERAHPPAARFTAALSRFARVIRLDKRGTGLSDRMAPDAVPTIEERVADVIAVMDAAEVDHAALFGSADGGPVAMVLAASYPERVDALILTATAPRVAWAEDWPWGTTPETMELRYAAAERWWGSGLLATAFGADDEATRNQVAHLERLASTPGGAVRVMRTTYATDVRSVIPAISAPALIVHHVEHPLWPIQGARYLAQHMPNARMIEFPGRPDMIGGLGARNDAAEAIEEFVTGRRARQEFDRALKTVLFTDIARSTERLAEVGDRRWRETLDAYDAAVARILDQFGGRRVSTSGDGTFATFDGTARAIACARVLVDEATRMGLELRAGIHTGECEVRGDDFAGLAVHIGARVGALAEPGEVLVTSTVRDLVAGSGIGFVDRGSHVLRGVPGEWRLLSVA